MMVYRTPQGMLDRRTRSQHADMMKRCYDESAPTYQHYGGRGIKVAVYWHNRETFMRHMQSVLGMELSLDRVDNDGDYTMYNCKGSTQAEQTRNMRRNIIVDTPEGEMCLTDAATLYGIHVNTLRKRRAKGCPDMDLGKPVDTRYRRT